jgi:hypothetical protein
MSTRSHRQTTQAYYNRHPLHEQDHATQEKQFTDSSEQNRRIETCIEEFAQALGAAFMEDVAKALEDTVHVGRKADEAVREGSSAEKIEGCGERAGNGGQ